jgi:transposase-like protein
MPSPLKRGAMTPQMQEAVRLVLGGMSWRKAAAAAGVSVRGLVKAIKREKEKSNEPTPD